jgi:broad specificity phosphatase PhoE
MARRLTLICCGATRATRAAAFPSDDPLEDRAAQQAAACAQHLRGAGRAYTAPAAAARQTAAALGLEVSLEPALRDCDYGRWAGRRLVDIAGEEPEALATWMADADAAPHGGESLSDVRRRIAGWLDELTPLRGRMIAVTHGAVMRAALLHILDAPSTSFWRIDFEPLSTLALSSDGKRWSVRAPAMSPLERI